MAMQLIDRPSLAHDALNPQRRGFSTMASVTLHFAACLLLFTALRVTPRNAIIDSANALLPQHIVWLPQLEGGGGRPGGGDHSIAPARKIREAGREAVSAPAAPPQPSTTATIEPPEDIPAIPVRAMGDATAPLAGTIDGDPALTNAGPGTVGAGDRAGADRGAGGDRSGNGFGPGISRGGAGVTMPTLIERVSPKYTADAMRARIQGSVWIECVVLPDGTVGEARVMRSLDRHFGLDEEALLAAKRWRFRPGRLNGQPVPVMVTIELMFSVR